MRSLRPTPNANRRGSDDASDSAEPLFIAIGRIIRPHGIRGEVAVEVMTDFPERFDTMQEIYVGDESQAQPRQVLSTRWHKDRVLIRFEGCTNRTAAEELRGLLLEIPIEEATPLPEDEYYPHQLVGLDVLTVDGEDLGRVSDVLFTKANEVYVVTGPRGQILLPAIAEVIEEVDLDSGHMVVSLMEGLI